MKSILLAIFWILAAGKIHAQLSEKDSLAKVAFIKEEKQISNSFNTYFNQNVSNLYGADEKVFMTKIDSLRHTFLLPIKRLKKEHPGIGPVFFREQDADVNYTFDKFILDYIPLHKRITGKVAILSLETKKRLQKIDITNPDLLKYKAFRKYLQSVLEQGLDKELHINLSRYKQSNNQRLDAGIETIKQLFKNPVIQEEMSYELLYNHMDNYGVKDIEKLINEFKAHTSNPLYISKIDSLYGDGVRGRKGHTIEPYKIVGTHSLDLHVFKPEDTGKKHPAIVFFHGGGWSEGMPDWFFGTCEEYAKKGWIAVAVEYRLRNRHGTLPPEAIADGKSAIRYLRTHADKWQIDPERIVASGNSAGANLALALAVIDTLDDKSENLMISSVPSAVILNSVATDLTQGDFWQQYYKDKNFLKRISPLYQVRKNLPPVLVIQGNQDHNVPLQPVIDFVEKMKAEGNDCELHILDGAGHFIWYDSRFSTKVNEFQELFLRRLGYGG